MILSFTKVFTIALFAAGTPTAYTQDGSSCQGAVDIDGFPADIETDLLGLEPTVAPTDYCFSTDDPSGWFRIAGDGQCYAVRLYDDINDGSFQVQVLESSGGGCDSLSCVAGVKSVSKVGFVEKFQTKPDTTYYMQIAFWFSAATNFTGDVWQIPCSGLCEGATPIPSVLPTTVTGDNTLTLPVTADDQFNRCLDNREGYIEFFAFTGTGTCVEAKITADFDARIAILSGECGATECFDSTKDKGIFASTEEHSTLSWYGPPGVVQHLMVQGETVDEFGPYSIALAEVDCPADPMNDSCESAALLDSIPTTATGHLELAGVVAEDVADDCVSILTGAYSVWYDFVGDGSCYNLDTANFRQDIAVFKGECDALKCAGYEFGGDIDLFAEEGVVYHVLLSDKDARSEIGLVMEPSTACEMPTNAPAAAGGVQPPPTNMPVNAVPPTSTTSPTVATPDSTSAATTSNPASFVIMAMLLFAAAVGVSV